MPELHDFTVSPDAVRGVGEAVGGIASLADRLLENLQSHEGQGWSVDEAIGATNRSLGEVAHELRRAVDKTSSSIADSAAAFARTEDANVGLADALRRLTGDGR